MVFETKGSPTPRPRIYVKAKTGHRFNGDLKMPGLTIYCLNRSSLRLYSF